MKKEFFIKTSTMSMYLAMVIIGGIGSFILPSIAMPIAAVLGCIHYFYFRKNPVFSINGNELVFNPSFIMAKKYFLIDDLKEISIENKVIRFKSEDKKVKLPLAYLSEEDKKAMIGIFSIKDESAVI